MNTAFHEPFDLIISDPVKELIAKKFDKTIVEEINKRIQKLKIAPDVYGKPLRGEMAGTWEIRFEKRWRILYKINYAEKTVTVTDFKHKDEF